MATAPFANNIPAHARYSTDKRANAREPSARLSRSPRGQAHPRNRCRKSRICRMHQRYPNGERAIARKPSAERRERAPDETHRENRLPPRGFRPIPRPLASRAAVRTTAVCARKTAAVGKQPVNSRTTFLRVRNTRTANARMRAPSACCSHFPRRQARSNEHCRKSRVCRMRLQHPNGKRATRGNRQHVILILRADKPVPTSIAGSHSSAVCACGNRPENAQRAEDVSASFPFSARTRPPTQSLPEVAYLPYAPATPERQTRERAGAVSGTKGACAG